MTLASSVDTWQNMPIIKQTGTYSSSSYSMELLPNKLVYLKDGDALGTCKEYVQILPGYIEERDNFYRNSNLLQGIRLEGGDIERQYWDYSSSPIQEYGWGNTGIVSLNEALKKIQPKTKTVTKAVTIGQGATVNVEFDFGLDTMLGVVAYSLMNTNAHVCNISVENANKKIIIPVKNYSSSFSTTMSCTCLYI